MELLEKTTITRTRRISAALSSRLRRRCMYDQVAHGVMGILSMLLVLLLCGIAATLLVRAWPLLSSFSLADLLLGTTWQPMRGLFGMAPFIVGSAMVTLVAMLVAVPLALLCGIYLAEYTPAHKRLLFKPVIDLLAGVPPVVYGLWGVLVVVPFVREQVAPWLDGTLGAWLPWFANRNPSGYGILAAGFVLGLMVFPLIVTITEEVLRAVPRDLRAAVHALGATQWEVTRLITLRAALPGILAAIVLGFSRAFGETLAVLMIVGNVPHIPRSLLDGGYTLSGLIANNYGEMMSVPLYESALMGAALVLLVVVVLSNIGARWTLRRYLKEQV